MARKPPRDPLVPIEFLVFVSFWLIVAGMSLVGVGVAYGAISGDGTGGSFASFGTEDACVEVENHGPSRVSVDDPLPTSDTYVGAWDYGVWADKARVRVTEAELCLTSPTFGQRLAASAGEIIGMPLVIGFLVLTRRLIASARRNGFFVRETADQVQRLGWLLVLGALLVGVATAIGRDVITAAAVKGGGGSSALWSPDISFSAVAAGVAVISVARVLRWAIVLQEDADTTV